MNSLSLSQWRTSFAAVLFRWLVRNHRLVEFECVVNWAVLKLGKPDVCLELERCGVQIASENVADVYCGHLVDAFPDAGCARQFTEVCLLHNLIHTNLKDHNDWRYRMAFGIAQSDGDLDS